MPAFGTVIMAELALAAPVQLLPRDPAATGK
jgi:hypothetical protein